MRTISSLYGRVSAGCPIQAEAATSSPSPPLGLTSEVRAPVRGPADMDREQIPRILMLLLLATVGATETLGPLIELENVAGKLIFYQMEGNATYVRDTGELASDIPTETMFELFDPQKNFSKATFSYTWDLGNGKVIQGTEPVVRYNYPESGNYTLRLKIGVNVTEYAPLLTDSYSRDVQVLDAIKHIDLTGPADYQVSQNTSVAFHVDGSPPMLVCWRVLPNCMLDMASVCTLTRLYENTLRLNLTFASAGVHCLDINASNYISKLQTSFSINVRRSSNTHLLFMLSCAAILVATFSFITVIACRPCQFSRSWVGVSSNAVFLKKHDSDGQSSVFFNFCKMERGEKEPLLLQNGSHYTS